MSISTLAASLPTANNAIPKVVSQEQGVGIMGASGLVDDGTTLKYKGSTVAAGSEITGLTAGFIPKATAADAIGANSSIDDGVTTANVVTISKPVTVPYIQTTPVAVASLPAAATAGDGARAMVTDATATTFNSVVAGSGTNKVPVFSDGTAWRIG